MKPDIIIYQVYYSYKGHVPFIESMIIANDIYDSLTIYSGICTIITIYHYLVMMSITIITFTAKSHKGIYNNKGYNLCYHMAFCYITTW